MEQFLIDSNSLIDYLGGLMPETGMLFMDKIINKTPKLSVITKIEVLGFNAPVDSQKILEDFISNTHIYTLTEEIVVQTISLRRSHKIKIPDAIIAATAIENNLTMVSRNTMDFKNISRLKIVNPHTL